MSNSGIEKGIKRCEKRIAQARNKLKFSRLDSDRDAARACIRYNESKKLLLKQQMIFNEVYYGKDNNKSQ